MYNEYLIHKNPLYALIMFSLPMALGSLFQQMYNTADSAVVGRYVSEQALAAVGASYSLSAIFIGIGVGGGIGASVVISQYFGAREYARMKKAIFTAFLSFLAVGIFLGAVGLVFSRQILIWLNTPQDALEMAVTYLKIYFIGLPFLFMYNIISSMFNALGNSKTPLAFLIISSVFNIILDVILVKNFQMGVAGVAWATFIAQGISAVCSFLIFMVELRKIYAAPTGCFDKNEWKEMTGLALPSIMQQTSISVGMLLVQSVVNGFGSQALAGFTAAIRVLVAMTMAPAFGIEMVWYAIPMGWTANFVISYSRYRTGKWKTIQVIKGGANG